MPGNIIVFSAPSGCGKSTIIKKLTEQYNNLHISVSFTTRPQSTYEKNGIDYHFVTKEYFLQEIKNENFLEYTEIYNNYYGTSKSYLFDKLDQDINVILNVDSNGHKSLREIIKDKYTIVSFFLLPPSIKALRQRLYKRNRESKQEIEMRITKAQGEMLHKDEFDHVIINDDLFVTVEQIAKILKLDSC